MTKGEAIERLLAQYAALRLENERTQDARLREAREADPRIARLMDENGSSSRAAHARLRPRGTSLKSTNGFTSHASEHTPSNARSATRRH